MFLKSLMLTGLAAFTLMSFAVWNSFERIDEAHVFENFQEFGFVTPQSEKFLTISDKGEA